MATGLGIEHKPEEGIWGEVFDGAVDDYACHGRVGDEGRHEVVESRYRLRREDGDWV